MENELMNTAREAVKYWWVSLIGGVFAIILGIWCFMTPDVTLAALVYLFIAAFIVTGLFEIIFALDNKKRLEGWGWTLTSGIIEAALGIIMLFMPLVVVTAILFYFVGFWIMFRSFWAIGEAFRMQTVGIKGWGGFLTLAILSLLFSLIFLFSPFFSGVFMVTFISMALILYGIYRISLSFTLKSLHEKVDTKRIRKTAAKPASKQE